MSDDANVITIAVLFGLLGLLGVGLAVWWGVRDYHLKNARKLKSYYMSNRGKGVIDQHADADLMSRKSLHEKVVPYLNEEYNIS